MDLRIAWFVLVAVLFAGFFFLEGFDFGVGILLPFLAKDDRQRRQVINAVGPFWDGNEVWLLTAGGAIFAAFPNWYATLFSGLYLALFVMLLALIVRAVGFEFRSKHSDPRWRHLWDWMIFTGSLIPALLWGVAMANLMRGLRVDATMTFVGTFWDLLNPFALLGGLTTLTLFTLHGSLFLSLRSTGAIEEQAVGLARRLWLPVTVLVALFTIAGSLLSGAFDRSGPAPAIVPLVAIAALPAAGRLLRQRQTGWAFVMTGLSTVFVVATIFMGLYPRVVPSTLNPEWSLTIYNASSSPYTLRIMTIIALCFVPIVLGYQAWTYHVFRQRIGPEAELEY